MEEKIKAWKEKHGRVLKLKFSGTDYYYRPITLDEYLNIQKLTEADESIKPEVETVKVGVLHPCLGEEPAAGIVLTLSDEILKLSGFVPEGEPEEL